jgi:hypothetical protein
MADLPVLTSYAASKGNTRTKLRKVVSRRIFRRTAREVENVEVEKVEQVETVESIQ